MNGNLLKRLVTFLAVAGCSLPIIAFAEDAEVPTGFEGSVTVGGHISNPADDYVGRVRRFDNVRDVWQPDLTLDLLTFSGANRLDLTLDYQDEQTLQAKGRLNASPYVDIGLDARSYWRWLDHDRLDNLAWREWVGVDSVGNDRGGGKMLTSEDLDPNRDYGWRYSDVDQFLKVHLPDEKLGTTLLGFYREQRREGFQQVRGVDHCANCHVRGQTAAVNELTRELGAGLQAGKSSFDVQYQFSERSYEPRAPRATNRFMQARHPVNGGAAEEFGSRLIYDDDVLVVSKAPKLSKLGHSAKVSVQAPRSQEVFGSFSFSETENKTSNLKMTANAAALSWFAPLTSDLRLVAGVTRRELDADSRFIDMPAWRDGRMGGGQDFDYTRLSSYDREEWLGKAALSWAAAKGHTVRLDYRLRSTDRTNVALDPDDPDQTRTTQHRIRGTWNGRLAGRARSRAWVEYEKTDFPYVALGGLCEKAIGDTVTSIPPGQPNDWIYYFQREKIGTGATLPTKALRGNGYLSYGLGARSSITGWLTLSQEKNDDLNLYDFERTTAIAGVSGYYLPAETWVFAGGVSYGKIESNAKICQTVMDG